MKPQFNSGGGQQNKISWAFWVLYHYQRMSDELASQGTREEYEDMLDAALNALFPEIVEDHGDKKVAIDEGPPKEMKTVFFDVMKMTAGNDIEKRKRFAAKERLLAFILYEHNIHLGKTTPFSKEALTEVDFSTIIPGETDENGLPGDESEEN